MTLYSTQHNFKQRKDDVVIVKLEKPNGKEMISVGKVAQGPRISKEEAWQSRVSTKDLLGPEKEPRGLGGSGKDLLNARDFLDPG